MNTTPTATQGVQGITEADIANYLANTPGFFERHAELLSAVQLSSPHGQRAVSLQERQMEMLRERIKGLEHKIMEMIRHSQENVAIADRLHRFTRSILLTADPAALPARMVESLQHEFLIPQATIRLWGVNAAYADEPFALPASDDVKSFAASLSVPYCGVNAGFEATAWLEDPASVMSLAMIPLRQGDATLGLLVLGSPDPTRYGAEMGTEFLMRIGDTAAAALSRLRPAA
ncbi:MAG: DUF484 family protein [Rubrivivax sp.]|nr:DUF484 family protein [Betaproteobacteria bacterium]MBP6320235.1 DUF484 family protein [Rubrivivax sp.]MBK7460304.1 DUF484 family protein [Betaproteobacteria bacterium]MBK7516228.1 DUF484 family protein [Betaproteobacteria bacterium]MBK8107927.1 DUF484 family protein [Betaproteobacteria bacterium]